jgi:tetratricopeptide (TPR) repeat protein
MANSNIHEQLADYNHVLQADPTNPYALALRGEIKYALEDIDGAVADFRKSLQYKSDLYFAHLRLTEISVFSESGSLSTERALELFPESARMHHNMGLALDQLGFTKMAVAEYNEASRLSPEWSRPYYMMAFADLERGDRDAAMIDLDKCVKFEPTWSWAYVMRAMQESKVHDYKAAIKDLDQAIAIEPDSKWLEACRARLKLSSGDTLGGLSDFIGIASRRTEFHILLAMWFILAQMKLVTLGRESIRRRLIVNE